LPDLLLALASCSAERASLVHAARSIRIGPRDIERTGFVLVNYRRENGECNYSCGRGFDQ
jgi:hypothetical protein